MSNGLRSCGTASRAGVLPALTVPERLPAVLPGRETAVPPDQAPVLKLLVEREPPWAIVRLAGELGWESHASFDACLSALTGRDGQRPWVCLDLSRQEFCDYTGIARMLRAAREIGQRGRPDTAALPRTEPGPQAHRDGRGRGAADRGRAARLSRLVPPGRGNPARTGKDGRGSASSEPGPISLSCAPARPRQRQRH